MITDPTKTVKLFFCYAREDKTLRDELEQHLSFLKRQKLITTWYDREITPGSEREKEIDTHLNSSDIILLLVSPGFMDSDYCDIEMKRALKRHEKGTTHVIPIILRPVNYEDTPFSSLSMILPTNAKPITTWPNRDQAYSDIAENIRKVTLEILANQWRDEGDSWRAQQEYEQALAAYEQAIRFNPSDTMSYDRKGRVLVNLHRFEEAVAAFEQALKTIDEAIILDTEKAEHHYHRGHLLVQLGKIVDVKIEDFLANDNIPDDDYHYHKDYLLEQLERYEKALAAFNEAINLDPKKSEFHYYKGRLLILLEQNKKSLEAYDQDIFLDPENNNKVLAAYNQAIFLNPKKAKYQHDRGEFLVQLKRNKEALAALDQAISFDPTNKQYKSTKDDLLKTLKQYEKDLAAIDEAISLDHEKIQSHYKRGRLLVQLERYEEALTAFDQVIHLELSKEEEEEDILYSMQKLLSKFDPLFEAYKAKVEIYEKLIQQTRNEMGKHNNRI
jgi:tetratricopeptide (TPR) repeat protein